MLIHFVNESRRNDAWLSQGCKELREHVDYFDSLPQQGHVTDDMWQVECILDERGAGKKREHLVRWTGFGPSALVVPTHLLVSLVIFLHCVRQLSAPHSLRASAMAAGQRR